MGRCRRYLSLSPSRCPYHSFGQEYPDHTGENNWNRIKQPPLRRPSQSIPVPNNEYVLPAFGVLCIGDSASPARCHPPRELIALSVHLSDLSFWPRSNYRRRPPVPRARDGASNDLAPTSRAGGGRDHSSSDVKCSAEPYRAAAAAALQQATDVPHPPPDASPGAYPRSSWGSSHHSRQRLTRSHPLSHSLTHRPPTTPRACCCPPPGQSARPGRHWRRRHLALVAAQSPDQRCTRDHA